MEQYQLFFPNGLVDTGRARDEGWCSLYPRIYIVSIRLTASQPLRSHHNLFKFFFYVSSLTTQMYVITFEY